MKLSSNYSRISIFDTKLDFKPVSAQGRYSYAFRAGDVEYVVEFYDEDECWMVEFYLSKDFYGGEDAKIKLLNKVSPEYSEQVKENPDKLDEIFNKYMENSAGIEILGIGGAPQILSTVIRIIDAFVKKVKPKCLYFTAKEISRKKLYDKLVEKYQPPGSQLKTIKYTSYGKEYRIIFQ